MWSNWCIELWSSGNWNCKQNNLCVLGTHLLKWLFKTEKDAFNTTPLKTFCHSCEPELFCTIRVRQHSPVCNMCYIIESPSQLTYRMKLNKLSIFRSSVLMEIVIHLFCTFWRQGKVAPRCKTILRWNFLIWGSASWKLLLK